MSNFKNNMNKQTIMHNNLYQKKEDEEEIENIFSKHKTNQKSNTKLIFEFGDKDIRENKKLIKYFRENNLIKEKNHYCMDEAELYPNKNNDKNYNPNHNTTTANDEVQDSDEEDQHNYFDEIQSKTIKDNFYCSYADYFDKIYVKNKNDFRIKEHEKNKEFDIDRIIDRNETNNFKKAHHKRQIISCAGCFNQIANNYKTIRYFSNILVCQELENFYLDYIIIFNTETLLKYLKEEIKQDINLDDLLNPSDRNDVNTGIYFKRIFF